MGKGQKGMIGVSRFIFSLLIGSTVISVLALIFMALTPKLIKRYSTKWIYYAWLIIVIGLIIPFRPGLDIAIIRFEVPQVLNSISYNEPQPNLHHDRNPDRSPDRQPDSQSSQHSDSQPAQPAGNSNNTASTGERTPNREDTSDTTQMNITPAIIMTAIWFLGMVTILICHVIRHRRFIRSIWRWGDDITDNRILNVWKTVRRELKITAQIGLQKSEMTGSPLLTGILYPRIMLPNTDIPEDDLAFILKHELIHYKRKDLWYKGLVLLAVAIHWFNPVVYFIAKTISIQCERSCDDEVIKYKDADSRYEYSTAIIHSIRYAESTTALSTNFFGGKKEMKNRISSIMNMKRKRRGSIIICVALLLIIIIGCVYEVSVGEPDELIDPHEELVTDEVPESVSIVGEWIMIETTFSTEKDGQEIPEDNVQPVLQTIYVFTDNTYKQEFHGHGTVEGIIHQTGHHEYTITDRSVTDATGTTHRDDEQWLRYNPENRLLRFTLYSREDNIYVHTYFERTVNFSNDSTPDGIYTNEQVQVAIAGNWRSQRHEGYTANDMIISLFPDGTWDRSGPLETDHVDGGRFFITRADTRTEAGIYHIKFIMDHSTRDWGDVEFGYEIEGVFQYDPHNDSLSSQDESVESPGTIIPVRYIRVPHAARDAAPTWNEDGLTVDTASTAAGREYRFDDLGFTFTLPSSWEGYYELRGDEYGIQVYFNYMGVFANLFFITQHDPDFDAHMIAIGEYELIRYLTVQDVRHIEFIMYFRPLDRSLLLATDDFSSFNWDLNDEQNQQIRETLSRMFHESNTIVADSIRSLLSTP